ncbi:MAG: ABC transporter substrate-binding protein [Armatimonadota bacterium]|nr:ABC transporter substrate-binding protein [Armatimonadota bacterium]
MSAVAASLVVLVLWLAAAGAGAPAKGKILIGASSSATWLPILLADARGFFAAEGVDVEIRIFRSAPDAARALVAGEIQFAGLAVERGIQATLQGRPVRSVMAIGNYPPSTIIVRADAPIIPGDLAALKGKTIGIVPGGWSEILVRFLVKKAGLAPGDVKMLSTPDPTTMFAALERRQVDMLSAIEPVQSRALVEGRGKIYFDLMDPTQLGQVWPRPFVATSLQATDAYLRVNRAATERVIRGIQRALDLLYRTPDQAVDYWAQQAPGVPKEVWSLAVKRLLVTWSRNGTLTPAAVANVQELLLEYEIISRVLPFSEVVWQPQ